MNDSWPITPIIDIVVVLTLVECAVLVAYHRATGRGVAPRDFAVNLVSGLFLMLALRALASDAATAWVASALAAAGIAHVTDLVMRWRRDDGRDDGLRRVSA